MAHAFAVQIARTLRFALAIRKVVAQRHAGESVLRDRSIPTSLRISLYQSARKRCLAACECSADARAQREKDMPRWLAMRAAYERATPERQHWMVSRFGELFLLNTKASAQ